MAGGEENLDETVDALQNACVEAQESLENQIKMVSDIDTKAIRIFRANIFLIGVIVSTLSVAAKFGMSIDGLINIHTTTGFLFLLGSTITAALTYAGTSLEVGIGRSALKKQIEEKHAGINHYERLAKGYANWLGYNERIIGVNALLSTVTIVFAINSIATFSLGAVIILNNQDIAFYTGFWLLVALLLVLLIVDTLVLLVDWILVKVHSWDRPYDVGTD